MILTAIAIWLMIVFACLFILHGIEERKRRIRAAIIERLTEDIRL